jgi:hypothetical protein
MRRRVWMKDLDSSDLVDPGYQTLKLSFKVPFQSLSMVDELCPWLQVVQPRINQPLKATVGPPVFNLGTLSTKL